MGMELTTCHRLQSHACAPAPKNSYNKTRFNHTQCLKSNI